MNIKFGPKKVPLQRIARVTRVRHNVADVHFLTGHAIRVKCSVPHSGGCTFSYPGTYEQLKAFVDKHKEER